MMGMNRVVLGLAACAALLSGCREEAQVKEPVAFESEAVLQLHPSLMSKGEVDWNREFEYLQERELLGEVGSEAGLEIEEVKAAVRFEVDPEQLRLRIIVRHESEETAKLISGNFSKAYLEARRQAELQLAKDELDLLDRDLIEQSKVVAKGREDLMRLIEEYGIPVVKGDEEEGPADRDRLTYEKALEALQDESGEGVKVPSDGVIFRKKE